MPENGRKAPRFAESVDITYEHEGLRFEGRISDLSTGGFFIDTLNPLPVGSTITFRFCLTGRGGETAVVGEGVVAWATLFQGMGIRITWISEEDRKKLDDFLSD